MNLAHARSLHERNPNDPAYCTSCHQELWPCPTALALGATGRSEWTDDATPTDPDDNPHDRPVFVNHDPCTDRPGCMLHRGHDGDHVYPNPPTAGQTIHEDRCWERDLTGQAGEIGPCVMRRNHTGQHCNPNGIRWGTR